VGLDEIKSRGLHIKRDGDAVFARNAMTKGVLASIALHAFMVLSLFSGPLVPLSPPSQVMVVTFHDEKESPSSSGLSVATTRVRPAKSMTILKKNETAGLGKSDLRVASLISEPVQDLERIIENRPVAEKENSLPESTLGFKNAGERYGAQTPKQGGNEDAEVIMNKGGNGSNAGDIRWGEKGAPSFAHQEVPVYPMLARRLGKEGKVLLKLLIDEKGQLKNVEVIEAAGYGFTEASLEAVKKSTFEPGFRNGARVATQVLLPVSFRLK